jgi:DNA-binding MarR family transcriptional regulator
MTTLLDRLERAGYLTRSPDPGDRRKVIARPSADAIRRAQQIYGPIAAEGARDLAGFTAEQLHIALRYRAISRELQERHLQRRLTGDAPSPG